MTQLAFFQGREAARAPRTSTDPQAMGLSVALTTTSTGCTGLVAMSLR